MRLYIEIDVHPIFHVPANWSPCYSQTYLATIYSIWLYFLVVLTFLDFSFCLMCPWLLGNHLLLFQGPGNLFLLFSIPTERLLIFSPVLPLGWLHNANIVSNTYLWLNCLCICIYWHSLSYPWEEYEPLVDNVVFDISSLPLLLFHLWLFTGYYVFANPFISFLELRLFESRVSISSITVPI